MREALQKAIDNVGGQTALGKALGVNQCTVNFWLKKSKKGVPPEYCDFIEKITGGAVTRQDLRPDIAWNPPSAIPPPVIRLARGRGRVLREEKHNSAGAA